MTDTTAADETIRPFRVEVPDEELADLRRRIAGARADRMGGNGTGRGLRGGTYTVTTDQTTNTTTIAYQAVHFSNDVAVTGQATRNRTTNTVDAQVTVQTPHRQDSLSFHGVLYTPSKPDGQVRGTIDGRPVALLVPMN